MMDMLSFEKECWKEGSTCICGIDEAGRGPLAGPVVAGAFVLPRQFPEELLAANDSKQLSEKKRNMLFELLQDRDRFCWAVAEATPAEIDQHNIYQATRIAMMRAVKKLPVQPDMLLLDAMRLPEMDIIQQPIIKGDARCLSIALASIAAKVTRDQIMYELDLKYPQYHWKKNKGYPTKQHVEALQKYGATPFHRQSYGPVKTLGQHQKPLF